jgi:hypothetical protein
MSTRHQNESTRKVLTAHHKYPVTTLVEKFQNWEQDIRESRQQPQPQRARSLKRTLCGVLPLGHVFG